METQIGINNAFYDVLGKEWYERTDHPIALLRAENAVRLPWIAEIILKHYPRGSVLDIGCGAGLLANPLAQQGLHVTGIDLSESSLSIAKMHDKTSSVKYVIANAEKLPFENESFDAVCALDLLEHVENPQAVVREASRVLKPGGIFFFHTFNRNFLSYLLVIKGVECAVKNTPEQMHIYRLFIKPEELRTICKTSGLEIETIRGLKPKLLSLALLKMLITRTVPEDFRFEFCRSLLTGYIGYAKKKGFVRSTLECGAMHRLDFSKTAPRTNLLAMPRRRRAPHSKALRAFTSLGFSPETACRLACADTLATAPSAALRAYTNYQK